MIFRSQKKNGPTKIHQEKINNLYKSSWNTSYVEWSCWRTHFVRTTSWQKINITEMNPSKVFLTKLINEKRGMRKKYYVLLRYIFFYDHCHNFFILLTAHIFINFFERSKVFVNNKYLHHVPPSSKIRTCPLCTQLTLEKR